MATDPHRVTELPILPAGRPFTYTLGDATAITPTWGTSHGSFALIWCTVFGCPRHDIPNPFAYTFGDPTALSGNPQSWKVSASPYLATGVPMLVPWHVFTCPPVGVVDDNF